MNFEGVFGQEHAKALMRTAIERQRLAHAYVFSGPDGVGKTLLAREVARALVCAGDSPRPCGKCDECRLATHDRHPDIVVVEPQEPGHVITIDAVRSVGRYLTVMPIRAGRKVVIFSKADALNEQASNALLKTLEEPASFALIILTTSRPNALLSTIRSRCQEVRFGPLSMEQTAEILSRRPEFEPDEIRVAASLAEGSVGQALDILQSGALEIRSRTLNRDYSLPEGSPFELSDAVLEWAAAEGRRLDLQRERLRHFLRLLEGAYRDALRLNVGAPGHAALDPAGSPSIAQVARLSTSRLLRIVDVLWDARRQTDANAEPALILQNLFLEIGRLQGGSQTAHASAA